MEFWSAEQLRKEFDVIASFYQIEVGSILYQCRSHAVIFRKGYNNQGFPDAIVCMANPGGARPEDSSYQLPIIQNHFDKVAYVMSKDDSTIRQLQRLMQKMNWNVISIINLSDLISDNMEDFQVKLKQVEQYSFKKHSIFDDTRLLEREALLDCNSNYTKIILAWGKDSSINQLACVAIGILSKKEKHLFGLKYSSQKWDYAHPFPRKKQRCIEWLKKMSLQLS
ncbi:DUF1643 domain-containing protein [Pseudoneobacillus rhizosphaerae]|uniref:DUF1643 domain-containing protein n=1 Tax=Pseudoneobacillus rhizosphaerae TaxID=2880968 RepID=A0A9C7G725_9BACI|nr:DUF1643 domain-containing protein [Pseudoneobacillus rhizosphaerae]CAG9606865.1 hypothetical protein NEOCIP111885_00553 [Pseudoneobacillus rhizosphaerae]